MSYRYIFYAVMLLTSQAGVTAANKKAVSYRNTFLQSADLLTVSTDQIMSPCLLRSSPIAQRMHSSPMLEASSSEKQNKGGAKLFKTFKIKKRKEAQPVSHQVSTVLHLSDSPRERYLPIPVPRERISDNFFSALSLYHTCHQESSPLLAMYVRMQISHIMDQLATLYAPIDLFAESTVYESENKEIIQQCANIARPPIMLLPIINDARKKLASTKKILQKNPTDFRCSALRERLTMYMKTFIHLYQSWRVNEVQRVSIHAYGEQTLALLHTIAGQIGQNTRTRELRDQWLNVQSSIDLEPFLQDLNKQTQNNSLLVRNPQVLQNKPFCRQLLIDQCNTLENLLAIHQANAEFPLRQYVLAKAADNILTQISKMPYEFRQTKPLKKIHRQWQEQHMSILNLLQYMQSRQAELRKSNTQPVDEYLEMLPILVEIYERKILPLKLHDRIMHPLHTVVDTLHNVYFTNASKFSAEEKKIFKSAQQKIEMQIDKLAEARYKLSNTIHSYIDAIEEAKTKLAPEIEKDMCLAAAKHIILTSSRFVSYDPLLVDRLYVRLMNLYQRNIHFSFEELKILYQFISNAEFPIPECLRPLESLNKESQNLRSFMKDLAAEGLIGSRNVQATSLSPTCSSEPASSSS